MDKYQEAIQAIKSNYPPSNYTMLREGLDLAIQALQKQILKKPIENYNWCDLSIYDQDDTFRWFCKCSQGLNESENYCPNCGQAIKWEDE